MPARTSGLLCALLAALALPATAAAQARSQQNLVDLGHQQYDDLRYDEALQTLSAAIIRRGNTRPMEVQIYELLGLSYLALGRTDEAEGAFRQVLIRDPEHALSNDLAPRIQSFFRTARQHWETEGRPGLPTQGPAQGPAGNPGQPVTIEHRSPAEQQRGRAVPLTANVVDPDHRVARLVLAYRPGNRGVFRRIDAEGGEGGAYHTVIPADVVRPPLVEYYLEAMDRSGIPVQARGDAFAPLRVAVPEPGGVPWWVWVGGGALVVGAVVTTVVVVLSNQGPAPLPQPAHLSISIVGM